LHYKRKKKRALFRIILLIMIIVFASQYKDLIRYFYPLKYNNLIVKYAKEYKLDPYLVSAIINVESRYDPMAESYKNAKGLMQITPPTALWAAEKAGIKNFREQMLFDPEININLGCWYLRNLEQEFETLEHDKGIVLILAAYNGGSGNVRKWLNDKEYSKNGITLDAIPFKETKQYVNKVLRNQKIYMWLYKDL